MAPRIVTPDASAFLKRTRSADNSSKSTPTTEKVMNLDDADLPNFLRQSDPDLFSKFERLNEKQLERLQSQASEDRTTQWTQYASWENRSRNRYMDIRPWDATRVKLKVPKGVSNYINASPILLRCSHTGDNRRYIATQGPKESSMEHFWQMVWHETDTHAVIIMLTQLKEGIHEKCYRYFPQDKDTSPMNFTFTNENGDDLAATLTVVEEKWHEKSKTTARTLQLKCQEEEKVVHHLFFHAWPDYGVPDATNRLALLELIKLSRDRNLGWDNPRVVHCSAGVGRTGTFIAVEHLLAELEIGRMDALSSAEDPVFETVEQLRQQRMTMVQSIAQFQFIYDMLAEAARTRLKETVISERMRGMSTGLKSPGMGEPAQKAMRFSRAVREAWSSMRERSSSRKRGNDSGASSPALTPTRRPDSVSSIEAGRVPLPNDKRLEGSAMGNTPLSAANQDESEAEPIHDLERTVEGGGEALKASDETETATELEEVDKHADAEHLLPPSQEYPAHTSSQDFDSQGAIFPSQEPSTQEIPLDEILGEPATTDPPAMQIEMERES